MSTPAALEPYKYLIQEQAPLANYSYMKVGGPADFLAIASKKQDLINLITAAYQNQIRYIVIGGGSNLIFSDAGYRGLVIVNRTQGVAIDADTGLVRAEAGVAFNSLINQTLDQGLAGLELFLGVPGSIGGAIYNNSHYSDQLVGDYVTRVQLLNPGKSPYWELNRQMEFAYDYSKLHRTHETVLEVELQLKPGASSETLKEQARAALKRRRDTQPLSMPSSGCMFQNPSPHFAGALIDQAGLKNLQIGGAKVSPVHANFIINTGHATANDVIALSDRIIETIKDKYGLTLEREVFILDEKGERIPA